MEPPQIITALAEEFGNRLLRLDPDTLERLGRLDGKVVCLELAGTSQRMYMFPSEGGVRISADCEGEPDVVVSGTPAGFARLGLNRGDREAFTSGAVELRGDAELAQQVQMVLASADFDWEEITSRYVGDVAAHQLGRLVRFTRELGRETLATLGQDAAEYLTEERQLLASRFRVNAWLAEVDVLRADVDRLEQRIRRLSGKIT